MAMNAELYIMDPINKFCIQVPEKIKFSNIQRAIFCLPKMFHLNALEWSYVCE